MVNARKNKKHVCDEFHWNREWKNNCFKLKWETKTKLALGKRKREVITQQVVKGTIGGLREAALVSVRCSNDCGLTREVAPSRYPLLSDNWIGCTVCPSWFCGEIRCIARFKKHHILCLVWVRLWSEASVAVWGPRDLGPHSVCLGSSQTHCRLLGRLLAP